VFTSIADVTGNRNYTSASFIPTQPGDYRWVATYTGDAANTGAGPTACGAGLETVTVDPAPGPNIDPGPTPRPPKPPKPKPPPPPPIVTG